MNLFGERLFQALEQATPEPGMLLVTDPLGLEGSFFHRSILLVLEHSETHSMAVILNQRSDVAVFNVLPAWAPLASKPPAVFIGGAHEQRAVSALGILAKDKVREEHPDMLRVANRIVRIAMSEDPGEVGELLEGVRIFQGLQFWGPGELEEEIASGDWYVTPALPSDILTPGNQDLWVNVLRRQPMPLPLFATYPSEIDDN
ncbi:YqgE/AlgH family protein [Corynebacterium pseudopelargi]|uniref:Uncharacterized protein n=1 Tax=Corynebacterium pseudopelargi TaxID=2080757 RepID=A0A3G6IX95_9CORY|nr:YqgE/AlgH family protein [Corynebacterium pseudopelargi]AZA10322.1 hypothetical protein CPPEL_11155 [Corynebacterium pseudopelargi]